MDLTLDMASDEDFASHMERMAPNSLTIVLYYLKDSATCQKIDPVYRDMSFKFQSNTISFLKVDADRCNATVLAHKITVMPTVVLYRNMEPLTVIQGAKPLELETAIRQELGKGQDSASVSPDADVGFSMGLGGVGDLYHFLDPKRCECLNGSDLTPFSDFIQRKSKLESDCDEQLILVYGFNQPVKIKSFKLKAPKTNGPKRLKLFVNQVASLDFDDVNSFKAAQEICLEEDNLCGESSCDLNQARFHDVTNLHIFISENMTHSDLTEVTWLTLYGEPRAPAKGISGKKEQVIFLD